MTTPVILITAITLAHPLPLTLHKFDHQLYHTQQGPQPKVILPLCPLSFSLAKDPYQPLGQIILRKAFDHETDGDDLLQVQLDQSNGPEEVLDGEGDRLTAGVVGVVGDGKVEGGLESEVVAGKDDWGWGAYRLMGNNYHTRDT
jgi:hypothetical protein